MASKQQYTKKTSKSLIPLLFDCNRFISDFKHEAELFNYSFSNQCSLINNNSKLPPNLNHITDRRISSVTFSAGDITKKIQNLNSNKAHNNMNFFQFYLLIFFRLNYYYLLIYFLVSYICLYFLFFIEFFFMHFFKIFNCDKSMHKK